jgi:SHS family lactate transporter-like MFS transporter
MTVIADLRALTGIQKHTVVASLLAWTFDAFDFFVLVFILRPLSQAFGVSVKEVAFAITLTLLARPFGALLFGRLADRYGRRPVLMINILCYSLIELASAFAPSLTVMLILRTLYGVAMGGMWGVAASLTFEAIPTRLRGFISGILQEGYALGYLIAAVIFGLLYPVIGWRGMFMFGTLPVLLIPYIWYCVPESHVWGTVERKSANLLVVLRDHWKLALFMILMMTAFNFLSHGTQDLYPTFLEVQHHFSTRTVGSIAVIYNLGAILGGVTFGSLSQRFGRGRMIAVAALLVLPLIPLWAFSSTPVMLALGAFLIQVMVQGAWGVVPVHLNELSPEGVRGTLPGLVYQTGNMIAAMNATLQAGFAQHHGGNYGLSLALVAGAAAITLAIVAGTGWEAKDKQFGGGRV